MGVLFIIAMVAPISTLLFLESLSAPDYLIEVSANENQLLGGVFVEFIWALAVLGIPVLLYPILRKHSEASALGFYSFRFIQAFLVILYSISLLSLITMSQEYVRAGAPDTPFYQTAGTLLLAVRNWAYFIAAGFAFSLSALILNYILFQSRLVPRWLSVWGFAGAALLFASYLAQFFGFNPVGFLFVPILVQEMVFAVWLIVKGFNSSTIASESAKTNIN